MHPRLLAALLLAASIGLSACATDEQLRNSSGDADYGGSLERPVVPNNGLCGAQYGVPMEHCDLKDPRVLGRSIGGIDWQGFPYNLPGGG